jgi:predicted DsbA family dithiol-disulfide isomerase
MSRLQRALFSGRRDTYDHAAMTASAVEVGIPEDEVRAVLAGDQFAAQVRRDQQTALRLGATGVPFVVLAGRYGIPGSGTVQSYADAIRTAWENR